jgi:hypothetical protein
MATLRLGERPWDEEELPDLCMKCGTPAEVYKDKKFSWHPGWVYVLLLVNLLVFAIVALALTKRRRVRVPLCAAHRHHWLWQQAVAVGGLLFFLGLGVLTIAVWSEEGNMAPLEGLGGLLCVSTLVGLVAWLIVAALLQSASIRPTEITDHGITLVGVSKEFVNAYREKQDVIGRIDDLARERWGRGRPGPSRPAEDSDRVRPDEDEPRRAPPDAFQEGQDGG